MAPNLRDRPFQIAAELDIPEAGGVDGVIVAHGSHAGGYALYIAGRRLHYVYNFLGSEITTASASVELPVGHVTARAIFTPSGVFQGDVELYYGDVPVGGARVPRTTPVLYAVGFAVGYQPGGPIIPGSSGPCEIPPDALDLVVVEIAGKPHRNIDAEAIADLAMQ
jgi:arylsulfatase